MPADAATSSQSVSDLQRRIDELSAELRARTVERDEARQREDAVAEILQVINASPGTLEPVFEAMLEKAMTLCGAAFGFLTTYDGQRFTPAAARGVPAALAEYFAAGMDDPRKGDAHARLLEGEELIHTLDQMDEEVYRSGSPLRRAVVDLGGARTALVVALRKEGVLRGSLTVYRQEVRAFSDYEVALVQSFATQAVIAIENARLMNELRESESRHALVSEAVAEGIYEWNVETNALWVSQRLIEIFGFQGRELKAANWNELVHPEDFAGYRNALRNCFKGTTRRLDCEYRVRHADGAYRWVEDRAVSVRNAAGRAVRLIGAVTDVTARKENERALRDALERQTATAAVLRIISESPGRLEPVFEAVLTNAVRISGGTFGMLALMDGAGFEGVATYAVGAEYSTTLSRIHDPPPGTGLDQMRRTLGTVEVPDCAAEPAYDTVRGLNPAFAAVRTALHIPMLKDRELLGAILIYRNKVEPFQPDEVELVENFARQAVIAIENARLLTEQREALEQQTATAEVLQVINASPGNLAPVFDAMLERATRLCEAGFGVLWLYDGKQFSVVATHAIPDALAEFVREPVPVETSASLQELVSGGSVVHIPDLAATELYRANNRVRSAYVRLGGARTLLNVALRKDNILLGAFGVYRPEVRPFSDKQIALVQNFAVQAVIAIENARLLDELRQRQAELARSVDELTATGDVLKVISRSSVDLKTVLETLVERVARLCQADQAYMFRRQDELHHLVAAYGVSPEGEEYIRTHPFLPERGTTSGRAALERRPVHIEDVCSDPEYTYNEGQRIAGFRTMLGIPLLREDTLVGVFVLGRTRVAPYTSKEIELVSSFADQAVIAIENARLFDELRERTDDLQESLEYQTATSELLEVISRSASDIQPVFETMLSAAKKLCDVENGGIAIREGDVFRYAITRQSVPEMDAILLARTFTIDRTTLIGRTALERKAVHIADVGQDAEYAMTETVTVGRVGSMLGVPLMQNEQVIGVIVITRQKVEPFTDRQIALIRTFADQAVIAMENARLLGELTRREQELSVTFDNMGDGVAMFDADLRLAAWNRNFQRIIGLSDEEVAVRPSYAEYLRLLAERGEFGTEDVEAALAARMENTDRELRLERTRPDGTVIEARRNAVPGGGFVLIYSDVTERKRAEERIRAARDVAEAALGDLKTAQSSLIHAEKMASLGQLTAGIAHEIKNPLNFVNNFAGLSVELLDELKETMMPIRESLDVGRRTEIDETIELLNTNLDKIASHGRRADGIVRSMLLHSRGGSGDRQSVDINAVLEEALNLAYHGARAQNQSFNVTLDRDLQPDIVPIEIVPQDVTRVFLNLIGNGFYAVARRAHLGGDASFRPTLKVRTRDLGVAVEIAIRDNGTGISPEHRARLFQPFFTTKPTGEGTGLGLSISYDIVTQQHGGTIEVESAPGMFTEFTVRLPRRGPTTEGRPA
ncbi:MAG: Adenylate cyclase [Enhydrobacter sp.]|jgi:PAS domain S-box-containing protein|nr:MAG: Adenylate cyclase [Enhydrobacter sp.]